MLDAFHMFESLLSISVGFVAWLILHFWSMEPLCSLSGINLVIEERLICKDLAMMLAG